MDDRSGSCNVFYVRSWQIFYSIFRSRINFYIEKRGFSSVFLYFCNVLCPKPCIWGTFKCNK
jgi:hypothetical protein